MGDIIARADIKASGNVARRHGFCECMILKNSDQKKIRESFMYVEWTAVFTYSLTVSP